MSNSSEGIEIVQDYLNNAKKRQKIIRIVIYILNLALDALTFGFIAKLVHLSFKSPFKNHIIGDLNNYFNDVAESNIIINNNFKENKNINNNSTFLRNLVSLSICKEIRESLIEFKGQKLSKLFDFNLDNIRLFSLISLCITIFMNIIAFACFIIFIIMICKLVDETSVPNIKDIKTTFKLTTTLEILGITLRFINVARFVISLILYHHIETSDLDKYDDFLDCKNVNKKFFEKFSVAEELRKWFYIYLALEIAKQGIEKLNQNFGIESDKPHEVPKISDNNDHNDNNESISSSSTPI